MNSFPTIQFSIVSHFVYQKGEKQAYDLVAWSET